ncbi:MAG: phenylacetate-CoA oxygenase/reductase subunit PaaK [Pseudonocardiales bacterium]|nr:MAG: phenylacetate-CoA oxygenase/reductase subunit PaaK [Pseudonocardiales bacterium]
MAATFATLRVTNVDRLCDDAVAVTFDVPAALSEQFTFRPGQSLTVRRTAGGRDERRSYSICAPAGARPRIGVREVAGGHVSQWLVRDVRPGDTVEVLPPTGTFTPTLGTAARHVLVAAGSGITPLLSIAASVLADADSTVTLIYGNRRSDTVMFADELADLKDRYPARFELVHVLSREPRESDVLSGRLDSDRLAALVDALIPIDAVDHWWLCGPFEMVEASRALLLQRGVGAARIHRELFYVEDVAPPAVVHTDTAPTGPTSEVTVVMDGRATPLTLPRDTPILDAAQRVRTDLPFACKGGVCGTCRAKVTHGAVHMRRNFALEQDELDAGFVLTCQALPTTDHVSVDYDA